MLHAMIDFGQKNDAKGKAAQQTLIEVNKKPPEEKKAPTPRTREVKQSSNAGKDMGPKMSMSITPDIGPETGPGGDNAAVIQSTNLQAEVFEEGDVDEKPMPISLTPIDYPLEAREKGIEGTLLAYFVIGMDGKVKSIDIQKSPSPIISREAKRTISSWRFKPGKKKGVPVNTRAKKETTFELQK
jgi:protein TonB